LVTPILDSPVFAKYKAASLKKILSNAALLASAHHFGIDETAQDQEDRIAWAKDIGLTQMLVPSLMPKNPTLDDLKRSADDTTRWRKAAQAGIQQGLHNEDFELSKVDGQRTYDVPHWPA